MRSFGSFASCASSPAGRSTSPDSPAPSLRWAGPRHYCTASSIIRTHTTIAIHVFIAIRGDRPSGTRDVGQTQLFSPSTYTSQTAAVTIFL